MPIVHLVRLAPSRLANVVHEKLDTNMINNESRTYLVQVDIKRVHDVDLQYNI